MDVFASELLDYCADVGDRFLRQIRKPSGCDYFAGPAMCGGYHRFDRQDDSRVIRESCVRAEDCEAVDAADALSAVDQHRIFRLSLEVSVSHLLLERFCYHARASDVFRARQSCFFFGGQISCDAHEAAEFA